MPTFTLPSGRPKTVIVTGGAGDIGAQAIRAFHAYGCNVVIADLPFTQSAAESLIASLGSSDRVLYHKTDITNWQAMLSLFKTAREKFGQIDIVIANAGLMESKGFFDFEEDENGELREPTEAYKVVDVNLKGSMNSMPSLNIDTRRLTRDSTSPSNARNAIESPRHRRSTGIHNPHRLHVWILRRHWRGFLHLFQARHSWSSAGVAAEGKRGRCACQCGCAVLHPDLYHGWLRGTVGRERDSGEYGGRRC